MKPTILVITPITGESRRQLDRAYQVIEAQDPDSRSRAVEEHGADIRAIVTEGPRPIGGEMIRALPNLELISAMSAGLDAVDLDAARAANIAVTNGRGGNADSVADLAITLMLSVYRQISVNQEAMRDSGGEEHIPAPMTMTASGKAMGIVGLGDIGSRIAKRAGGFGISVRYHNRNRCGDVDYEYLESAEALAAVSDVLVLSCPASSETGNLVNAGVLGALPPTGIVVNVARGSVLDSAALLAALESRQAGRRRVGCPRRRPQDQSQTCRPRRCRGHPAHRGQYGRSPGQQERADAQSAPRPFYGRRGPEPGDLTASGGPQSTLDRPRSCGTIGPQFSQEKRGQNTRPISSRPSED